MSTESAHTGDTSSDQRLPVTCRCALCSYLASDDPPPRPDSPEPDSDVSPLRLKPRPPLSKEELTAEVEAIYTGLIMIEKKCTDVHQELRLQSVELKDEQWRALHTLHSKLLDEHHDFLLAIQHPTAPPNLRRLAMDRSMPARMWRHGVHPYLTLLQDQLPQSQEHLRTFVNLAYGLYGHLHTSIPTFAKAWAECLGHLALVAIMAANDVDECKRWASISQVGFDEALNSGPTSDAASDNSHEQSDAAFDVPHGRVHEQQVTDEWVLLGDDDL
ncbi:uncharacterized protein B0I36DRAFT_323059 [Microdochium trichocladiopsis]|uniref:Uncharacterized protein n=1 Tax=Microdochium trichocladiopsis TaxID=1682393 RepID=A0A9P8Y6U4_9PEZI|nr:uncharacterized protein B0I36DRAFT_323059 [Microdochium trichocladiopsis]KAH7031032.1 hypothetical protein B0I36DRAFT_323059 [Microdochium trichocladiopsis]